MTDIKQLLYRSIHRGCKETDFLIGNFATENLSKMTELELAIFDEFLQEDDMEIYDWILSKITAPKKYLALLQDMQKFHKI